MPREKNSFGKSAREKVAEALKSSHKIADDTAAQIVQILLDTLAEEKNQREETEYLIPILVEYSLYAGDDTGRDLGEISWGILEGVTRTSKELNLDLNEIVVKTARAMLLESDWRDVDLGIVIESFIRKNIPDGKTLVKKVYQSEKCSEEPRKAA